jgi:hypothetical protein
LTICFFMLHNPYKSKQWYLSMHKPTTCTMYLLNLDVVGWLVIKKAWMNRWTNILIKSLHCNKSLSFQESFHKDDVHEIIKLAQYALTLPLHTCSCERVFSNQNLIVTRLRSWLNPKTSERLLRVRTVSSETSKPGNPTVVKFACFRSNLQHVQCIFLIWMSWVD